MNAIILYTFSSLVIFALPSIAVGGSGDGPSSEVHRRVPPESSMRICRGACDVRESSRGGLTLLATGLAGSLSASGAALAHCSEDLSKKNFLTKCIELVDLVPQLKALDILPPPAMQPAHENSRLTNSAYLQDCRDRLAEGKRPPSHGTWREHRKYEADMEEGRRIQLEGAKRLGRMFRQVDRLKEENKKRRQEARKIRAQQLQAEPSASIVIAETIVVQEPGPSSPTKPRVGFSTDTTDSTGHQPLTKKKTKSSASVSRHKLGTASVRTEEKSAGPQTASQIDLVAEIMGSHYGRRRRT